MEGMFKLDTGAEANVLPMEMYVKINAVYPLNPTKTVLVAF